MSLKKSIQKAKDLLIESKLNKINYLKNALRKAALEDEKFDTEGFMRMLEHRNNKLAEDPDSEESREWHEILEDMMYHPGIPSHAVDAIVDSEDPQIVNNALYIHNKATGNELFSPDQLMKLTDRVDDRIVAKAAAAIAKNKDIPLSYSERLLDNKDVMNVAGDRVIRGMTMRPDLTPELIDRFASSDRSTILNHPNASPEQKERYVPKGHVKFPLNTNKLRQLRDFAEEKGGSIHKKEAEKSGFNLKKLGVDSLLQNGRVLSSDDISNHIDSLPKHTYRYSHEDYGTPSEEHANDARDNAEQAAFDDNSIEDYIEETVTTVTDIPEDMRGDFYDYVNNENADDAPEQGDNESDEDFDERRAEWQDSLDYNEHVSDWVHKNAYDISHSPDYDGRDDFYEWVTDKSHEYMDNSYRESEFDSVYEDNPDDALDYANNEQRHNHKPSEVFVLDASDDHKKEMSDAGVLESYEKIKERSKSGHPGGGNSLGWVRYTENDDPDEKGIHIDEIQSDISKTLRNVFKEGFEKPDADIPSDHVEKISQILFNGQHPSQLLHDAFIHHKRTAGDIGAPVHIWTSESKAPISGQLAPKKTMNIRGRSGFITGLNEDVKLKHYKDLHPEDQQKIADLAANHAQKTSDKEIYKNVSSFDPENYKDWLPAASSDYSSPVKEHTYVRADTGRLVQTRPETGTGKMDIVFSKPLPIHTQEGYNKQPKAMGYKPAEYGELETQSNPRHKGKSTWSDKIRKSKKPERDSLEKADKPKNFDQNIRDVADSYTAKKGYKIDHDAPAAELNPDRSAAIARAFSSMPHTPDHPEVKQSYNDLMNETADQLGHILNTTGLKISEITPDMENPYSKGSKDLFHDVRNNNHMWYYPTSSGFGSSDDFNDHPLMRNVNVNGKDMNANDVFRIVHDYFGHAKEGHGFGPKGEEKAWQTHMKMYSPSAQKALTSETRGQNSWVNFGPHGESNRKNPSNTVYADQKAGLLPDWAMSTDDYNPDNDVTSQEPVQKSSGVKFMPGRHSWRLADLQKESADKKNSSSLLGLLRKSSELLRKNDNEKRRELFEGKPFREVMESYFEAKTASNDESMSHPRGKILSDKVNMAADEMIGRLSHLAPEHLKPTEDDLVEAMSTTLPSVLKLPESMKTSRVAKAMYDNDRYKGYKSKWAKYLKDSELDDAINDLSKKEGKLNDDEQYILKNFSEDSDLKPHHFKSLLESDAVPSHSKEYLAESKEAPFDLKTEYASSKHLKNVFGLAIDGMKSQSLLSLLHGTPDKGDPEAHEMYKKFTPKALSAVLLENERGGADRHKEIIKHVLNHPSMTKQATEDMLMGFINKENGEDVWKDFHENMSDEDKKHAYNNYKFINDKSSSNNITNVANKILTLADKDKISDKVKDLLVRRDPEFRFAGSVIRNENNTSEDLKNHYDFLSEFNKANLFNTYSKNALAEVIKHKNSPAELLEHAAASHPEYVVQNPNASREAVNIAYENTNDPRLKKEAAIHPSASNELFDNWISTQDIGETVHTKVGSHKLRQLRDMIEEKGGSVSKKEAEKGGFNLKSLGISADGSGKISSEAVQNHIDNLPGHDFTVSHDTYYGEPDDVTSDDWDDYEEDAYYNAYNQELDVAMNNYSFSDYISHNSEEMVEELPKAVFDEYIKSYKDKISGDFTDEEKKNGDLDEYIQNNIDEHFVDFISNALYRGGNRPIDRVIDDVIDRHQNSYDDYISENIQVSSPSNYDIPSDQLKEDSRGSYEAAMDTGVQRHSTEASEVFQLNMHPKIEKELKSNGVWDVFDNLNHISRRSGHPVGDDTIGWVRYTKGDDGVHIDEIQSDFGSELVKQLQNVKKMANEGNSEAIDLMGKMPISDTEKVNKIIFKDKHPSQILHDSFLQHLRDKDESDTNVHIWHSHSKAPISGMSAPKRMMRNHEGNMVPVSLATFGNLKPKYQESIMNDVKDHLSDLKQTGDEWDKKKHIEKGYLKRSNDDPSGYKVADENITTGNHDEWLREFSDNYSHGGDKHFYIDSKTKEPIVKKFAGISNKYSFGNPLPVHMKQYDEIPKKAGYKPAKYGELETQHNPILKEQDADTWKEKVRKADDVLEGGRADEMNEKDFDPKKLRIGAMHEIEHTLNYNTAKEIAMDHLAEDPNYYQKLKRIEK